MAKYIRSARAQEDLADIWHYIAFDNQDAAKDVINAAYKTFELLAANPELGMFAAPCKDCEPSQSRGIESI